MDREALAELFSVLGPVAIRRMFSGHGISAEGVTFALALRGIVLLKVDETTRLRFVAEGSKPFQYEARGRTVTVNSYWSLPERLYDDPDELVQWARGAVAVAHRTAAAKAGRRGGRKSQATVVR
jgi:DNA transformation protein